MGNVRKERTVAKNASSGEALGLFMAEVIKRHLDGQQAIPESKKCYMGYVATTPRQGDSMRVTYYTFRRIPGSASAVADMHQRISTPVAHAEQVAPSIWKVRTYSGTEYVVQVF